MALENDHAAALAVRLIEVVGPTHVLRERSVVTQYETDWTGRFRGEASLVVRPGGLAEVVGVLTACRDAGVPVVPQGGNTGLVGGGVPMAGAVVLSMTRLDELSDVDVIAGQVTAGAGVTLERLQRHAAAAGWDYPVDFAARGTATVGGMIATNAGGIRVLRDGTTRRQVLGVEAVTVDGRVLTRLDGLVKDNAGYDLPGLLAGSEGTLAVITRARLRLLPPRPSRVTALVAVRSLGDAQAVLARVRARAPSLESAEAFLDLGLELVLRHTVAVPPFAERHPAYLLIECAGQHDPTDDLAAALGDAPEVLDVAVAVDAPGRARLWRLREAHTDAIAAEGIPVKLDVSLPAANIEPFVNRLDEILAPIAPAARAVLFGHLGDGNLHVNVLGADPASVDVEDAVLRLVTSLGGSISAEHGIGRAKTRWLGLQRDETDLALMGAVKRAFDPDNRLNPGVMMSR